MAVNPVFVNELRQSAFRRQGIVVTGTLLVAGTLFAMLAQVDSLRNVVVYAPVALLPLIVPAIASGAFAKEYEQQTWLDLTLTRLTNAQVVWGKFGAYFVQVAVALFAFFPSLLLMLLGDYSRRLSDLRFEVVPLHWQLYAVFTASTFIFKLLVSACLYVLLTMVCSRYSPNRRTAITWSYIAMALYTGFGMLVWTLLGSLDYQNQITDQSQEIKPPDFVPIELTLPGFMESFHLIFCGIVGIGSFVLLWVSLSEQRGYKGSGDTQSITRAWQPISRSAREPIV
jgi:ABC-type transport system involved in multi-copper enzyme maturation permease subunit